MMNLIETYIQFSYGALELLYWSMTKFNMKYVLQNETILQNKIDYDIF